MDEFVELSRRERQIMDVVYALREASVNEVLVELPDAPTRTSVRTLMRILEEKGHLRHRTDGRTFVYRPVQQRRRTGVKAMRRVLDTFFGGSLEDAVAAHLTESGGEIDIAELRRLARIINEAKKRGM